MFELDNEITKWREQMLAAGIETPMPLEELECHLREDVEQQVSSGLDARQAFEAAARRLGSAIELKSEFEIVSSTLTNPDNLFMAFTAIVTFATIITLALPYMNRSGLEARLKSVANRREELRRKSREAMANKPSASHHRRSTPRASSTASSPSSRT